MAECIDDYVAAVGGRLRGPGRLRADMLAEIRDALDDAAEAHRAGGAGDREAERRAVAEFGAAPEIAAGLQDVLAVAHGRRTAIGLLAVLGSQLAVSTWVGRTTNWRDYWGDVQPGPGYLALSQAAEVVIVGGLVAAVLAVVCFGWGLRYLGIRRGLVRLAAAATAALVVLTGLSGTLLTALTPNPDAGGSALLNAAFWSLPFLWVLRSARASWRAAV